MTSFFGKQPSSRIIASQSIAYTGDTASHLGSSFGNQTFQCRIVTQVSGYVRIDNGAAATTSDAMVISNNEYFFSCTPGQSVAFISTSTTTGNVSISEMS